MIFDDFGGVPGHDGIIGNVFGDHRACSHHRILPDRHTRADDRPDADPGVLLDGHFLKIELVVAVFQIVIDGRDADIGADLYAVFNIDDAGGKKGGAFIDRDVFP